MKKRIANLLIAILVICLINTGLIGFLAYDRITDGGGFEISFGAKKPIVISRDYDKGQSMDKALATGKPIIVWFYADWCGYCQKFAPTFKKLTTRKNIKKKYAVAYVNAEQPENKKFVEEYDVHGFPSVFVVSGDKKDSIPNSMLFNPDSAKALETLLMRAY